MTRRGRVRLDASAVARLTCKRSFWTAAVPCRCGFFVTDRPIIYGLDSSPHEIRIRAEGKRQQTAALHNASEVVRPACYAKRVECGSLCRYRFFVTSSNLFYSRAAIRP